MVFCRDLARRAFQPRLIGSPMLNPIKKANAFPARFMSINAKQPTGGPISWGSFFLTAAAGAGYVAFYMAERDRKLSVTKDTGGAGRPKLGGKWTLVDTEGKPVTDAEFRGKHMLLYFGFTFCPDICPNELVKLGSAMDQIEALTGKDSVSPVFISVDPHRDTVGQLAKYKKDFHPSIKYLTGTEDMVSKATRAYRVYFSRAYDNEEDEDDDEDYLVDHSIVVYAVDPNGDFLQFFTQSAEAEDMAQAMAKHVLTWRKDNS